MSLWEELAVLELEFYKNMHKNLQAIDSRLQEIEEEYLVFPHTYFDEEQGRLLTMGRNFEDMVLWKIEAEENLVKAKERIIKRCNRVVKAFNQLEGYEQEILDMVYLDNAEYSLAVKGRLLGYRQLKPFERAIRRVLLKFYRFILREKIAIRNQIKVAHQQSVKANLEEYLEDQKRKGK